MEAPERNRELAWRRAQAASGVALAIFVGIHILNVPFAMVPGGYDAYQDLLRTVYQTPILELLLVVLPISIHVAAGIRGIVRRRARTADAPLRTRLHRWAAWYLLAVLGGHVFATRGTELLHGVWPGATGVRMSLEWVPFFFVPYYALLAVSGLYHLLHGLTVALGILGVPTKGLGGARFWVPVGVGSAALLVGLAGLAGWLYATEDPFFSDYAAVWRAREGLLVPAVPPHR